MKFAKHIGIDYSGAMASETRLQGLQVFISESGAEPVRVAPPGQHTRNWTRLEVAQYCRSVIESEGPAIIGIDHGFSFPLSYMQRYGITDWDRFLEDFMRHWPTADPHAMVDDFREGNSRSGSNDELRLCERWTTSAKSVFQFDVQGQVAKSTHAGLPWILWLRTLKHMGRQLHFWPFDGFDVPEGSSVIAEIYPSMFRRRYPSARRSADEHDAYCVAAWLSEMDRRNQLDYYFHPPLTLPEQKLVRLEGWVLGVC